MSNNIVKTYWSLLKGYIGDWFIEILVNIVSRRMGKRRFQKLIISIISPRMGEIMLQDFYEYLNRYSLLGMNIGRGGNPENSGEKNVLDYLTQHFALSNDLTIFDVGANIGEYSTLLKQVFSKKAVIHAFEPSPKTFGKLKLNIGDDAKIRVYNFGFGDSNAKTVLYSNADESGLASVYKRRLDHFNINMDRREEIEIKTLDTFCDDQKIDHIHFLKLDVEGNELRVLEGASKMLSSGGIDFIQFEFGGCNIDSRTYFQDFYYLLSDRYQIYRIVMDGLYPISQYKEMYEAFITTNYLAEKKS